MDPNELEDRPKFCIKQQSFDDPATGLTLEFFQKEAGEYKEESWPAEYRLRIYGENLPYGNREFCFDLEGRLVARGTCSICE